MFSIKVRQPNSDGYKMHPCETYEVKSDAGGVKHIVMTHKDASTSTVTVLRGGMAFVVNDIGKTVDIIPPPPQNAALRGAR